MPLSPTSRKLSLDWWSFLVALTAVVLIKSGLFPHVPW